MNVILENGTILFMHCDKHNITYLPIWICKLARRLYLEQLISKLDVLTPDRAKPWSHELDFNMLILLWNLTSASSVVLSISPVKFQSDRPI